jgi:aryl-alcohol dehydrogenase-like predicted oxidoreductase
MMAAAFDAGVNFFDNAEVYAGGRSEEIMGAALKTLRWPRLNYVVSTKFFWGLDRAGDAVNRKDTLNRKYLMQAIDGSLQAHGAGAHRPDLLPPPRPAHAGRGDRARHERPHHVQGKALYWGTSEWSAADIRAAWEMADRHHLHKPVMEQPQYHLFHRQRVEQEYARLYDDIGLGLTTWSPLASGLLTGKYRDGVPEGSRGALESMAFLRDGLLDRGQERRRGGGWSRSRPSWAARWRSWPIAWVARNPRRQHRVITGRPSCRNCRPTWARWRWWTSSRPRCWRASTLQQGAQFARESGFVRHGADCRRGRPTLRGDASLLPALALLPDARREH